MVEIIIVLLSIWITASVIKGIFRGIKRLLFGPPKQGIDAKQKLEKDNAKTKKTPDAPPKSTAQKQKPKTDQKKEPEPAKTAQQKSEPAKTAQKEPKPAKTAQQKKSEPVKKPAPKEEKKTPREPQKNLPLCCARCGVPLVEAKCSSCGFDHKKAPVIYLCHPTLSQ